ncbi:hypothetical protein ACKC9G_12485 [Pokkaliibacter sp. CJK22405]|uniref:hypothetical protein n=1 Tax=Pokkaliibacter sp. CJK22405 TaxID=3384615 RepID=UPI003984FB5D
MPTIRGHLDTYSQLGNSDASSRHVKTTKSASHRQINNVSDVTMVRLKVSSKVGKTVDKICDKGNQLDDVYKTSGEAVFRAGVARQHYSDEDQADHKIYAGNCGEMADFTESILSAVNTDRQERGLNRIPVVFADWPGDHHFMMLGDPRAEPASSVVTVDGWVMRPSAHTLNNSAFQGSTVSSSTAILPSSYLGNSTAKRSMDSIEEEMFGHRLRSGDRREVYYDMAKTKIRNHEFKLWDHQYADNNASVVQYYQSPRTPAINFDFLPRAEKDRKSDIHQAARNSGLQRAVQGVPGMRDLAGMFAQIVLDR